VAQQAKAATLTEIEPGVIDRFELKGTLWHLISPQALKLDTQSGNLPLNDAVGSTGNFSGCFT